LTRSLLVPTQEVFDAGRNYERRQMMKERNRRAKVVQLRPRDEEPGDDLRPGGTG